MSELSRAHTDGLVQAALPKPRPCSGGCRSSLSSRFTRERPQVRNPPRPSSESAGPSRSARLAASWVALERVRLEADADGEASTQALGDLRRIRGRDERRERQLSAGSVKHGGISAQQADTAAAGIAHLAGAGEAPAPFEPVLRGMLLTGHKPLFIAAHVAEDEGWHSEVYDEPPWPSDEKVVAEELGPYLREQDEAAPRP